MFKIEKRKKKDFVMYVQIGNNLSFLLKNTKMVHYSAKIMLYSYSGDQNEHFEYLINIQGPTETEKHTQNARVFRFFSNYLKGD